MELRKLAGSLFRKNFKMLPFNINSMTNDAFVDLSYQFILRRAPDKGGRQHFLERLNSKKISKTHLLDALIDSSEFAKEMLHSNLGTSLHESRVRFVRQLPAANIIVDLGGSCQDNDQGAMVSMGYPYKFEKLTIIDLPIEQRHELYQNNREIKSVQTDSGIVEYLYRSMSDLAPIADNSVDLVYSGQSIEHVNIEDANRVYKETLRVLKPGGIFSLDTPNGRITRIQQDDFIDPDHKIEYRFEELNANLIAAGFEILETKGLNFAGAITDRSEFDPRKIARNCGIYSNPENCYLLAFVCRKPNQAQ